MQRSQQRLPLWFIAALKMTVVSSIFLLMPSYLNAISHQFTASVYSLTYLASIELSGFAVASLFSFIITQKKHININERWACAGLFLAHLLSAFCHDINLFIAVRIIAGVCAGLVLVKSYETLAAQPNPDNAFGKAIAMQMLYSAILFVILPPILAQFGVHAFFFVLALLSLVIALLPQLQVQVSSNDYQAPQSNHAMFYALSAMFMLILTHSGAWSLLGVVASKLEITPQSQGNILATGTLFSLVGAVLASYLAYSQFKKWIIVIAVATQGACIATIFLATTPWSYFAAVSLFMLLWNLLVPLYMGTIASIDKDGSVIRLAVASQTFGAAIGPYILLQGWALSELLVFLSLTLLLVLPLLPASQSWRRSKKPQ